MSREKRIELRNSKGHEMTFKRYHRYSDMLHYLEYLSIKYPELVEMITIGKSSLGQPLKVVKVSTGQRTKKGEIKPAVWIDGGTHAREWISPAVVMYTLKQLVENFKINRKIVEGADWYILPVSNPDGYEYSHSTDRFWRKTRSNHEIEDEKQSRTLSSFFWGETCRGVDMNRNWNFHWGEVGASDDPCQETYAGPRPFSEPETRAISDFIMDRKDRIKLYLTMHAYSQMWLIPWGYTNKKTGDYDDLMSMGRKAVDALNRVSGTQYQVGHSPSLLYPTSGGADDWAKGVAGIKYAYTVELRDDGTYGFLLPASQIVATGKETFAAIKAVARAIVCKN
ncbi:Carboxypeptidase B [Cryptotermes secundus]|uniref:Carboxypeptidase B n=2 Tax=Cryptotermes secundus TaxID=105785 RepID=A0A2J7Q996_9NEOP|nr:Carboxypeptidase B [Cryptotermes secundus]